MWTTVVAAVAALSAPAAEPGTLTLSNVRATYGILGPVRADSRVLPGDSYVVSFDIEGVRVGPDGKVSYTIATEVRNAAGGVADFGGDAVGNLAVGADADAFEVEGEHVAIPG